MPFSAAISRHPLPTHAAGEVIGAVVEDLGERPDLALLLVTGAFAGALDDLADTVAKLVRPAAFLGSTAASVLAGDEMVEGTGAVVLFAATWRGRLRHGSRGLRTIAFDAERDGPGWRVTGGEDLTGAAGTLLLLSRRDRFPTERFVDELHRRNPDLAIVGGSASSPNEIGEEGLVLDGRRVSSGAVGVLLPPGVPVRAAVSQGARPVGEPLVVTAARDGLIEELAGRPALDRVLETAGAASIEDRRALARAMNLGLILRERADEALPGDVLVRRVPGADRTTRAVAVDAEVPVGTTVQLQARDARAAEEDLLTVLSGELAAGALVFGDLVRGRGGHGIASRDAASVADHVPGRAIAGLACAAEIGPIAGRPWLHDESIVVLLFDD